MKPFDIEEFKAGAIGITRDGSYVKFVVHVPEAHKHHQVVVLNDGGSVYSVSVNGYLLSGDEEDSFDIIGLKLESRVFWVNFYPDNDMSIHHTESEADGFMEERFRINGKAYRVEVEL